MSIVSSIKPKVSVRLGLILLAVPGYFIGASVLRRNAPGLSLLGSPVVLLGALFVAFTVNALSVLSVNLRSDVPPVLNVSLSLRFWNLAVIVTGLVLLGVLLGYVFVENFQARSGS
jgi:hydrogenase-4 membrane subunit HyfE